MKYLIPLLILFFACKNQPKLIVNHVENLSIIQDSFAQDISKCQYAGNWKWEKNSESKFSFCLKLYTKQDSLYGYYEGYARNGNAIDESPFPCFKIPFPKYNNENIEFWVETGSSEILKAKMIFKNEKIYWKLLELPHKEAHALVEGTLIKDK
jgi:hypothetical protein